MLILMLNANVNDNSKVNSNNWHLHSNLKIKKYLCDHILREREIPRIGLYILPSHPAPIPPPPKKIYTTAKEAHGLQIRICTTIAVSKTTA